MNKTKNYNMNLPEVGEFYDVNLVNENTEILDEKLKELSDALEGGDAFVPITGGEMQGELVADETATATLTTAQMRNVHFGTEDLETGVSELKAGEMYFSYEEV